jgi:hypothetical protein
MKDKPKILTIFSGIITILLGIFFCVLSVFVLLSAITGTDPWLMLASLGMLIILQIILFIMALGIGIAIIAIGSLEIRLGTLNNYEYSLKKGSVIGYCIFNGILIFLGLIGIFLTTASTPFVIISSVLTGVFLLCFVFKIIDYKLFKRKIDKGLISIEKPASANFANVDLSSLVKKDQTKELEKINDLKEKNLISEEEYQNLRKNILDNMIQKK